jgi:regulator of protease activity HflC (stomatin/prohibitin superfamily)
MEELLSSSITLLVLVFFVIFRGTNIVPQSDVYVVERLGKFYKILEPGFHIIIPFIDSVRRKLTYREQIVDIERQAVITQDNVNVLIDGIVFIKVQNPKDAIYNVENYKIAISNLATTTLRGEVGRMSLDEIFSNRSRINASILAELDSSTEAWGIKTMRVEIRDISVPKEIEEAMNLQMKAEREKRAVELGAIAQKEAVIREAEGTRQKEFLTAEAIERMADAKKYEQETLAEGQKKAIQLINDSLSKNNLAGEFLLAKDRVKAFEELAKNPSKDKVILPYETTEIIGSLSLLAKTLEK